MFLITASHCSSELKCLLLALLQLQKYTKYILRPSARSNTLTSIRGILKKAAVSKYKIRNHTNFFDRENNTLISLIKNQVKRHRAVKLDVAVLLLLRKSQVEEDGELGFILIKNYFKSNVHSISTESAAATALHTISLEIDAQVEKFIKHGSNWSVYDILLIDLNFTKYRLATTRGHHGRLFKSPVRGAFSVSGVPEGRCFEAAFLASYYRSLLPPKTKYIANSHR